jgi:putative ABC transport system ATP-binding protein
MSAVISVRDLTKIYQVGEIAVHALRGISLEIQAAEFVTVVGPSGSGKSTLMHILGCLDKPTSGEYFLDGKDVSRLSDDELSLIRNRQIGFVFQGFNLLARTSALENVELPMIFAGRSPRDRRALAKQALESVGLGPRLHHRPTEMSGGENQRVAVARALVNRPEIVLADEPTGNLDSATANEVMALILEHVERHGATLVLVTHDEELAGASTDRVLRLKDGRLLS